MWMRRIQDSTERMKAIMIRWPMAIEPKIFSRARGQAHSSTYTRSPVSIPSHHTDPAFLYHRTIPCSPPLINPAPPPEPTIAPGTLCLQQTLHTSAGSDIIDTEFRAARSHIRIVLSADLPEYSYQHPVSTSAVNEDIPGNSKSGVRRYSYAQDPVSMPGQMCHRASTSFAGRSHVVKDEPFVVRARK